MAGEKSQNQWLLPPRPDKVEDIRFFQPPSSAEARDMADTSSPLRGEIITESGSGPDGRSGDPDLVIRESEPVSAAEPRRPVASGEPVIRSAPFGGAPSSDQLARLEDKTARIEEKLARSEAATQRVVDRFELASSRMSEVALQSDLAAVRGEVGLIGRRVRSLPGFSALIATAIVTALLTSVLFIAILRYLPTLLPR